MNERTNALLFTRLLSGLQLAAEICSAVTTGVALKSRTYTFRPNDIRLGEYTSDPGTAGSITLLLQLALPCLLFASPANVYRDVGAPPISRLILKGGSNTTNAPQTDYVQYVLFPFLVRHFKLSSEHLTAKTIRRGFWPKGGGTFHVTVPALAAGHTLPPIDLTERGQILGVKGVAFSANASSRSIAEMQQGALSTLHAATSTINLAHDQIDIQADPLPLQRSLDKSGYGIVLWAETSAGCILGGSAISQRGKSAFVAGAEAAEELLRNISHGGCVDEHLQVRFLWHYRGFQAMPKLFIIRTRL